MTTLAETIRLHKTKPWIPDFWRVLIRPVRGVNTVDPAWLGAKVVLRDQTVWYIPTDAFWVVHARASHPIDEQGLHGCAPDIHTAFLTRNGKNAEFEYGYQTTVDGLHKTVHIETAEDFRRECAWWDMQNGNPPPTWKTSSAKLDPRNWSPRTKKYALGGLLAALLALLVGIRRRRM